MVVREGDSIGRGSTLYVGLLERVVREKQQAELQAELQADGGCMGSSGM